MDKTKKLKGVPVSPGKIRGKVKILIDLEEKEKIKEGDILVTNIVKPDLDLLKKVKAVVTDEGGATCHVAIRCRELNIPCVIGTKVATKIFKDDNEVKIDADEGIIEEVRTQA